MGFIDKIKFLFSATVDKSASTYQNLWLRGHENSLYGGKVSAPYSQVATVYKAIKSIADNVPQADIAFYDKKTQKEVYPDELIELFAQPNPLMSGKDFLQAIVGFYALYGELMIIKWESIGQRIGTKKLPAELWTFNPSKFQQVTGKNELGQKVIAQWRYEDYVYAANEIIHIKDFNPYNCFRGLAPTMPIGDIIDIDYQTMIFNKAFFENDATPGFMLSTEKPLAKEQVDRLRDWWEKRHKGASKAFKMAVLEGGLKPSQVGSSHKDMDFIEQKRFTREEILGIWRAPKALFNITEDLNYATFVGQMKMFWVYTLMPILRKIEDGITKDLVQPYNPNIVMRFDIKNVPAFQEDLKDKVAVAKDLQLLGIPLNHINEKLNLGFPEYPWGNTWWAPFSVQPVTGEPAEEPKEEPKPEGKPSEEDEPKPKEEEKNKIANHATWKNFLSKQVPLEKGLDKKLKNYFSTQRTKLLAYLKNATTENILVKVNSFDWEKQDELLKDKARPFVLASINDGIEIAKAKLGNKSVKSEKALNDSVSSILTIRLENLVDINATVKRQLGKKIGEGIQQGSSIAQITEQILGVYDMATVRAFTIARTETVGAVNNGSVAYYDEVGIKQKEWVTAGDENVRETHRQLNGDVVRINQKFDNGLEYPGDQTGDAAEVINCRCTLAPVVD